ncbi:alcohol dehydrogenase catalytic domain-containing protein [Chloroflexi bacterium TSY]|nr:alcohol dehydrogenase catalytic domain-containing protein [Chloroflexi bacterium TSY]
MKASGICGSDLHIYRRSLAQELYDRQITAGHEPSGEIIEVGAGVTDWAIGDRAVVYFRRTCGVCIYCRTGHNNVCKDIRPGYGFGADGSHAEYMVADATTLMRLPEELSFRDGAILACQGGTAYAPLARMNVGGRDVVAISGLGPVGLLATRFAVAMGATVIGIDPVAARRTLAEQMGTAAVFDPGRGELAEQIEALIPTGVNKLVETSGATSAHQAIGQILQPLGTVALVGLGNPVFTASLHELTRWEYTVLGSSIYPQIQWDEMCRFILSKQIVLDNIVGEDLKLDEGKRGFEMADAAVMGKICIHFDET